MAVVIHDFELISEASSVPPAATPGSEDHAAGTPQSISEAALQRAASELRERALRLFAH
jgi:hypothetical protein